ncbi:MAG: shikimate dehydrogenase [Acidobacteriota bacterium]|nr:shikimate dehydrogenase [Acidobacteriota bacterium]
MGPFGSGKSRVCAVVAAPTAATMTRQVRAAWRETPTIELRLDWLSRDAERAKLLRWVARQKLRGKRLLATCRRVAAGGKFRGSIAQQLFWLMKARDAGCSWCDVEVETLRELPGKSVRGYAVPSRVLLSMHDFERTPALPRKIKVPNHGDVDAIKIAAMARTVGDSLRLLMLARRSRNFVASPMGEIGLPARILALREGSALAYAPVGETTAPGQVSLRETIHLYRAHELTRQTRVYGVIGEPVGHSLSPLMHNTGFIARNLDAVYLPFLVHELKDFLAAIAPLGIRGFSVTIPHKQTILKYLDDCDPLAAEIGAVNTVMVRGDGSLFGCNTDYVGVLDGLARKLQLPGSHVLILGAGGAARAAAFALARAGAVVTICARRENLARELARAIDGQALPRRALRSEKFDAILNATPLGMHPHSRISPLSARELNCRMVMDLIYRPQHTELLNLARKKGIVTVSGVEMFLSQGVTQWELWMAKRAPEAAMRRAVLQSLRAEEKRAAPTRRGRA